MMTKAALLFLAVLPFGSLHCVCAAEPETHDVVIYGGTSAGIIAGIQSQAMGKSVVVIEPTSRLGGLTTGGLGQTDIGRKQVIGGLSREFYRRVALHYASPAAWNWQQREQYKSNGQSKTESGEATQWTFEPSAALKVYQDWVAETGLTVIFNERLNRESGVKKKESRIVSIEMESGRVFAGKMFIDATYEGDLMASTGVRYTIGREAASEFDESYNGVQTQHAEFHNFPDGIDPYRVKGDPSSGLLPFVDPEGPGKEGSSDHRVQAFCFRMCLTDHPDNRIPFQKPKGYDETWYELLFRSYEIGKDSFGWINSPMPNRKTDTNNRNGFSTDFIGQNYDYPDASYAARKAIVARHRLYQQGLMWTMANHPRVPESLREKYAKWGTCKDEFEAEDGWQQQLYIREARRMRSDFVMTQNHCKRVAPVTDSICMGAYTMDSHNVQRYVTKDGFVKNEGDVEKGGFPPYPISFRALLPRRTESDNLLVPVCLSSTHIAFGSIRMEPVFMMLGQSAATVASLAIDRDVAVQDVDYVTLKSRLEADGQILEYVPSGGAIEPLKQAQEKGVVVDDVAATLQGTWTNSSLLAGVHRGYLHDSAAADGASTAIFATELKPGQYKVQIAYTTNSNRATNVPVLIGHAGGTANVVVNQRLAPDDGRFATIGSFRFDGKASVKITNRDTDGHVIVDATRWIRISK